MVRKLSKARKAMKIRPRSIALVAAAFLVAGALLISQKFSSDDSALRLYGTVDTRTVRLAFEEAGRLTELTVAEGATVKKGDRVATIDAEQYQILLNQALATEAVAEKNLDLLLAGARSEDIAAAKARLAAAEAAKDLSNRTCRREKKLGTATTPLKIDQACSQAKADKASAEAARKELERLEAGTRAEEIAVARAELTKAQVQTTNARRALRECVLLAPADFVVRARLKEPGDMVSASVPVLEGALMNPLWIRAWVDEVNLGRITPGMKASVVTDSAPGEKIPATVGFVSTVAEFTPKSVQTEAVRTTLVYEVRLTVNDEKNLLRLGMPVTVKLEETHANP